jgi:hypothetical protein
MIFLEWEADRELRHSADEHVIVGPYELVVFDMAPSKVMGRKIGWQIFAGSQARLSSGGRHVRQPQKCENCGRGRLDKAPRHRTDPLAQGYGTRRRVSGGGTQKGI